MGKGAASRSCSVPIRDSWVTARFASLASDRRMDGGKWVQGPELHRPSQAYETWQSTGSPCVYQEWVDEDGMLRHLPGANRPCKLLHHKPIKECVQGTRTRGGLPGPSRRRQSCVLCLWRAVLCCQPGPRSMKCLFGVTGGHCLSATVALG